MRILVTGGTGFIGSRLIETLLENPNYQISFTGRKKPNRPDLLERGAKFLCGDLADRNFAKSATQNIDAIIHSAGMAGTWGAYEAYYRANVLATQFLLEGARANGVRRVINISSPSIYFDFKDQINLKEGDLPPQFSNAYAKTKYEAEVLVQSSHSQDLQTVSLRPRSVIGRGDQNVLPRLIRLQETGNLVQIGGGKNIVDITTIGNLIHAISLCLHAQPSAMGETYNITNGSPVRFWDFVDEVLTCANLPLKLKHLPRAPVMLAARLNEFISRIIRRKNEPAFLPISIGIISFSMTMDISKARNKLGYVPQYSTRDGIMEFFENR